MSREAQRGVGGVSKYHQVVEGEWVPTSMRKHRNQCCGCGLVHVVDFRMTEKERLEMRVTVNRRATAAARRAAKFKGENGI